MRRYPFIFLTLLVMPGCSLLFPEDWREGVEETDKCIARVKGEYHKGVLKLLDSDEQRQPTFTFDITKMSLDDINAMTVSGEGNEKGSVRISGFEAPAYKLINFLDMGVDEKGAFYVGADPSYYRVRGEPIALRDVFSEGCNRQKPGMRFLSFTFTGLPEINADTSPPSAETPE